MNRFWIFAFAIMMAFSANFLLAATLMETATRIADESAVLTMDKIEHDSTAMPINPNEVVLNDIAARQSYLLAMQRYYEYRADGYAYRSRVFEWQLLSSKVIFITVLVLVLTGLFFAAIQFRLALRAATRTPVTGESITPSGVTLSTQLEISSKGLVINSSVLGVIILTFSLIFFYFYLVYVYPVKDVL